MKGFIEVTLRDDSAKIIVSVNAIQWVGENRIVIANRLEIYCKESYEEIKQKIEEAAK